MAIEASDVVTQFGAYYKAGSDAEKTLRSKLYKSAETAQYFRTIPTSDTIYRSTYASQQRVVQAFQKGFTPISTLTVAPNQFDLFPLKIDVQEYPDVLEETYLGFLTDVDTVERTKWPFVRWWLEEHVLMQKEEDLETAEYFLGEFVAPTPNVAGNAGESMNGIRKSIRGYNTAGRTNLGLGAYAMGALADDPADFCLQIEGMVEKGIPKEARRKIKNLFMNDTLATRYRKGRRKLYGKDVNFLNGQQVSDVMKVEDYPNIEIVGLLSHGESELIWTSIPQNMVRPMKRAASAKTMAVKEYSARQVSAYTDWWETLNFEVPEFVFHNDLDLA